MIGKFSSLKNRTLRILKDQAGAVAFEYVLIIGGVSAVIVGALAFAAPGLFGVILDATCSAVEGVFTVTTFGDCTP